MHRVTRRKVILTSSASSDDGGHVSDIDTAGGADTEADEIGDAYASTKAMGDADRESGATRHLKSEHTADVHTVFIKKDDYVDPHTGLVESGHVCTVCHQGTLNGIIVHQPRAPAFTTSGLLDYVVELIMCEDKAFQLVDKGPFRRLLTYLQPSLSDKDIPHRKAVCNEILKKAEATEVRLKEILKDIPGKVSFTFDAWTSDPGNPFLSVTGHYIHAPPEQPNNWKLKAEQLAFTPMEGRHSGANMASLLMRTIDHYHLL
ncbi:hypothetical protein AZE42_13443 [Rhizopogon vesiculosus]|uniref:Uncharacterized protein n=1 Tax=Rhizopogon vesiculosus TaxID=180088 RepID=A0A1J8PQF8_9AGAM|nr:hypothetical protein AZE42_13443 [Rhizopogon vesiculosus]